VPDLVDWFFGKPALFVFHGRTPFSPYSAARNRRSGWVGKMQASGVAANEISDPPQRSAWKIPLPESQVEGTKQRLPAGGVFF
jgi:hypothetical protein